MSNITKFRLFLEKKLKESKPGQEAHMLMSPMDGTTPFRTFKKPDNAMDSAVLILLKESIDSFDILFTLRSKTLNNHSGQISFPGGRVESNESIERAALRENEEEIGISPKQVLMIGELSPLFVPPSNSVIHPFVGLLKSEGIKMKINPDEVDEAFFVPIDEFKDDSKFRIDEWDFNGRKINVPYWNIHKTTPLWGATAMILKEFLVISQPYFSEKNN